MVNGTKVGIIAGIIVAIVAVIWLLQRPRATHTIDYSAGGANASANALDSASAATGSPQPGDCTLVHGINGDVNVCYQPDAPTQASISPFFSWSPGDPYRRIA